MAFQKEYHEGPFEFGGKTIEAHFETLPGEAEAIIGDMVRDEKIGLAQAAALHVAMTRCEANGKVIFKNTARGAQRTKSINSINQLPSTREYYDREAKESLVRRLLKRVVEHEFWLVDMYPEAFEEFVEEPEDAETGEAPEKPENPTEEPSEKNIRKVS